MFIIAKISNTINISFRVDKEIKEQGLPFQIPEPSERLKIALKELEKVESGKIKLKGYNNMKDLIKILNED